MGLSEHLDTIHVNQNTSVLNLDSQIKFFIDEAGDFDVEDVGGNKLAKTIINKYEPGFYKGGDLWARFSLKNVSHTANDFILDVGGYNEINVFYRKMEDSVFQKKVTGRYIPYPVNELGNNRFRRNKVQIKLEPRVVYEFIIHYPDPGWDKIKPALVISSTEKWLFDQAMRAKVGGTLLGVFFGVSIVLAFISLVYYFINSDKAYLLYTVYILTIVYFEASRYGVVDSTPLVEYPILYFFLENIFLILTVIYYFLFLKSFLNTKDRYPRWNKIVNALTIIFFVGLLICLYFIGILKQPLTAIEIRNYFLLLAVPFGMVFLVTLAAKGNKVDKIFLIGSIVLFISGLISLLLDLYFKENRYPDLVFQIGVIIELTVFNIALGVKSRSNEKEKQIAQESLIVQLKENDRLQKSINLDLEKQVEERTSEIQAQNEELTAQQEELAAHRDLLEGQNEIIAKRNHDLQQVKKLLEVKVEKRTQQLKNANLELLRRNTQLEQYGYITAHNLRGPVARLKGLIYIFEKLGGVNEDNVEIIEKITSSAMEMDDVLSDMNKILELKNNNHGQTQQVDFRSTIEKVKKFLADDLTKSNAQIDMNIEHPTINANETYIESIFYNLMSNSVKYKSAKRDLNISINTSKVESRLILEFSDNGLGIDLVKFGDKIFGLYQRFHDHVGGKGLGLYLVKTQVEALEGTIKVESQVDQGLRFIMDFPA